MTLNHIGCRAAGIGIRIVNPGSIDHVFAQIVTAYVHQLTGIQCASSQMGFSARVSSHSIKGEVRTHNGHVSPGTNLIYGCGMPGIGKIHVVEIPRPGNKLFGTGAFFRGTPEENNGTILVFLLKIVLQRHSGGITACAQKIMSAAMTVSALLNGLLNRAGSLLAQSGKGIVLRKESHHGLSGATAECGCKGSGNTGNSLFDGKALFFQRGNECAG